MTAVTHKHIWLPKGDGAPVLVVLHGTGSDEQEILPLGKAVWPEASLLSIRGNVSEYGAARYFRRFAEGVFDEEDIAVRTKELTEFLAWAGKEYGFERCNVVGYSNGANMAAALMLAGYDFVKAVLMRPMVTHTPAELPRISSDVLLLLGNQDTICEPESGVALATTLHRAGAKTQVVRLAARHNLTQSDAIRAHEFFHAS